MSVIWAEDPQPRTAGRHPWPAAAVALMVGFTVLAAALFATATVMAGIPVEDAAVYFLAILFAALPLTRAATVIARWSTSPPEGTPR